MLPGPGIALLMERPLWRGAFLLTADTQESIGDLDNFQMDLLINLDVSDFMFCTSWLQLSTVFPGIAGQVLQVTSVMQCLTS